MIEGLTTEKHQLYESHIQSNTVTKFTQVISTVKSGFIVALFLSDFS